MPPFVAAYTVYGLSAWVFTRANQRRYKRVSSARTCRGNCQMSWRAYIYFTAIYGLLQSDTTNLPDRQTVISPDLVILIKRNSDIGWAGQGWAKYHIHPFIRLILKKKLEKFAFWKIQIYEFFKAKKYVIRYVTYFLILSFFHDTYIFFFHFKKIISSKTQKFLFLFEKYIIFQIFIFTCLFCDRRLHFFVQRVLKLNRTPSHRHCKPFYKVI